MATTVTPVALTATITESVSLNNHTYGNTVTKETTVVGNVAQRIMSIGTAETTVLVFGSADGQGTVVGDELKYLRITNLDNTNWIKVNFKTAAEHYSVKLDALDSYVVMSNQMNAEADTGIGDLEDMITLTAIASGSACDIEFIAITD
jgi:hypothetical protein